MKSQLSAIRRVLPSRFGTVAKQPLHLLRRLEVELVVGSDVPQCAVYGGVVRGCDERVLEFVSLRAVVEYIIRCYKGCTDLLSNTDKLPVALRIPM